MLAELGLDVGAKLSTLCKRILTIAALLLVYTLHCLVRSPRDVLRKLILSCVVRRDYRIDIQIALGDRISPMSPILLDLWKLE